jgi:hypothetical protein
MPLNPELLPGNYAMLKWCERLGSKSQPLHGENLCYRIYLYVKTME